MTAFSPFHAATEGLRVIRREPTALLGWIGVWVLALVLIGVLQVFTLPSIDVTATHRADADSLMSRFGPLAPVLVLTILILWIMTTASLYRAVLRPDEHGWHLFKLGADEARLGILTAAASLALITLGSGPALILWLLAKPVLGMAPASGRWIVAFGTVATVVIQLWIAVRLSLAAVHTFAEGRFHFLGYWRLTDRHFWQLAISYVLVFVEILIVLGVLTILVVCVGEAVNSIGAPHGADILRRGLLLTLVGVAALLGAILFVIPLTLVCACQAVAYAAIVKPDPAAPWGASRGRAWPSGNARVPRREI